MLYSTINQRVTRWSMYSALEKDNVLRTYLDNFWRRVQFQRSMWQVSPVSLPTLRWVSLGKTFSYASQKSLKVWQARYCFGILCHKRLHVSALRSPIAKATIWRVRRQIAVHNQHLAVLIKTNDQTSSNSSTSLLSAGSKLSLTVGCSFTFFEQLLQSVARNMKRSSNSAHTWTFMVSRWNLILVFLATLILWIHNCWLVAVLAQELLAACAILAILYDIRTVAFWTVKNHYFLYHLAFIPSFR